MSKSAGPELAVAGLTRFSSVDYPGYLSAVVFIPGCPWRCSYCHNPEMQRRVSSGIQWPDLLDWLHRRKGLLDAVVFSGGEATLDPALPEALIAVRALGFKVGLHTAGMLPHRLPALLPVLDWVGLDIKSTLDDARLMGRITGLPTAAAARAGAAVKASLALLLESSIAFECRSTIHPQLHDESALLTMARQLRAAGVQHWALQIARPEGCANPLPPVGLDYPSPSLLDALRWQMPELILRRD